MNLPRKENRYMSKKKKIRIKKCHTAGCGGNLIITKDGFATCNKCGRKFIKN